MFYTVWECRSYAKKTINKGSLALLLCKKCGKECRFVRTYTKPFNA